MTAFRELREQAGMRQIELARLLGVSRSTIDGWERKGKSFPAYRLNTLSHLFEVPVSELRMRIAVAKETAHRSPVLAKPKPSKTPAAPQEPPAFIDPADPWGWTDARDPDVQDALQRFQTYAETEAEREATAARIRAEAPSWRRYGLSYSTDLCGSRSPAPGRPRKPTA